ncbi:MAG: tetratricopeptide repeat protein [Caldithrix sp.]|nr:tetratricopeptide repeat protein [Caldithrix sp.]
MIDENNPETIENFVSYIEREQYGQHSILDREGVWKSSDNSNRYDSTWDFFWDYQIQHMYVRYFLWQFVGMDEDETNVALTFLGLPFLLGLIGFFWHFWRDPKHALAVFALFFMTGIAIVLYLNQPDPQPRERDYSYVGSFFAFSIWIGLGYAALIDMIKTYWLEHKKPLKPALRYGIFALLLVIVPINMLAKNYESHDRSGNYVAWDYSYNMLMSCEPNGILFTNGDNDTFPLWYLQEVEEIRTDVRIVNLSLLNTDWYIRQLRDMEPKVPMRISEMELDRLGIRPWKKQTVTLEVPKNVASEAQQDFKDEFPTRSIEVPQKISFDVEPTINTPYGSAIRTQDFMILNIIASNRWRRPIYFAVTVPRSNMLSELANYMRMDGAVLKLIPYKNWRISPTRLERNLMEVYQFRGLNDPSVYYNNDVKSLLQNYRSAFIQLAEYYLRIGNEQKFQETFRLMNEKISADVIPWTSRNLRVFRDAFQILQDSTYADSILTSTKRVSELEALGEHLMRMGEYEQSIKILEGAYELNPNSVKSLSLLINAYRLTNQEQRAIKPLERWLETHPNDRNARRMLQQLRSAGSE